MKKYFSIFGKACLVMSLIVWLAGCSTLTTNDYEQAIKTGNLQQLGAFYKSHAVQPFVREESASSAVYPLHTAVLFRQKAVITFLLDRGYPQNAVDSEGKTALHLAVAENDEVLTALLIDRGVDINIEDKEGKLAFRYLDFNQPFNQTLMKRLVNVDTDLSKVIDHETIIDLVKKDVEFQALLRKQHRQVNESRRKLLQGLQDNRLDEISLFAQKGYTLNFSMPFHLSDNPTFKRSYSPLIKALETKNLEAMKLLIKAGADPEYATDTTPAALNFAISQNEAGIITALVNAGADINRRDYTGNTPLINSLFENKKEAISAILASNPDINGANNQGLTPLMAAVYMNQPEIAEQLIRKGADLQRVDDSGWSALHFTVNHTDNQAHQGDRLAKLLIDAGVDINRRDQAGNTALLVAAKNNRTAEMRVLIDHHADVNLADHDGWAPLHQAVFGNREAQVKMLLAAGANPNQTHEGWAAIHYTVNGIAEQSHDAAHLTRLLIEAGADINQPVSDGSTPLSLSIHNQRGYEMEAILAAMPDVNLADKDGIAPLHIAVVMNKPEVVKRLLEAGANINSLTNDGWAPLHLTVNSSEHQRHDGSELTHILIAAGADINQRVEKGFTPLFLAVINGRAKELDTLLKASPDVNLASNIGQTPLHAALTLNKPDLVDKLIRAGAHVNQADHEGWAPLHYTVNKKERQPHNGSRLIRLLLAAGADVNRKQHGGYTPLDLSILNNRHDEMKVLLEASPDLGLSVKGRSAPLHLSVYKNDVKAVKLLIQAGADLNLADLDGWTPLFYTVNSQKNQPHSGVELAALLIKAGAKVNIVNKSGQTPLSVSVNNYRKQEMAVLLSANANVGLTEDEYAMTPLHRAVYRNYKDMAEALIKAGADVNKPQVEGWTPLHFTVNHPEYQQHDAHEMAQLLIAHGAQVDAINNDGYTPLMLAAYNNRLQEAKVIIQANADLSTLNSRDNAKTALDYAMWEGHDAIVALLKKGRKVQSEDEGAGGVQSAKPHLPQSDRELR